MKIQAQSMAESAEQHKRDQEDRERRFVALVYSYLSEHGLVAVPLEPTDAVLISMDRGICSSGCVTMQGRMGGAYKAMIAAQGEAE
jgi:hypothetical protein